LSLHIEVTVEGKGTPLPSNIQMIVVVTSALPLGRFLASMFCQATVLGRVERWFPVAFLPMFLWRHHLQRWCSSPSILSLL